MPFDDQDQQVDLDTWEKRVFEKHGVPEGLRMSIRSQESGGDVNATSPTGVKGRYQVTQGAAKQFGLNRDDPWEQPVAAAKLLRQNYDNAKTRNPKFSDRQAWLAASASYYAGSDAFDASGNLSTGSKDGLSNPSRYAESIAKRWSDFERGQVKPEQPFLSADQPSPLQRSIRPGTQKTTVRGPVRPVQLNPFSLAAPDIVGDAAAIAGRISPEVAAEADRAGRELARFQSRSRIGQLGEVAAGGLMQGVDQMVKAASYVNPLPMASAFRGRGALTPAAAQNLQAQQSAQDVALPNTAPIVRGTVAAGVQLPAIAMAGPAAPLVAGGLAASSADWRDPKRAALQTAIGLAGGAAGGKLAQMAIRPATIGGRLASGVAGGAAGNVIPTAVEQLAYEGKLNPQQLAQQAVIGAATGAALPPGVDPRSGGRQPVQGGESPGQIRAKYARPRGTPLSDAVATMDAIQAERTSTDRLPEGWGGEEVRGTAALPEPVRPPSNPLDVNQANATEAKINASQAENLGDWTRARTEYDTAHAAMVRMRRALGRTPGAEDEISALDREISAADLNRKRAARQILATEREQRAASRVRPAARQQDAVENAPTADLPSETNPLLKSVVNPEGGIPAAEESPSGLFGQLARQQAAGQAKPARGAKGSGQLSAVEYLKRASNGEGIRVSDRGEARVLGAREAGIVGLTNRASKYAVSDAQVMLDEGGFNLPDGRKFTDPSVTENDVLSFLTEFGREGRMNTRDLDNRIEQESADYYANQPPSEPLRATSNRLPRIGDLPPSRVSRNLQPEKPEIPRGTDRPLTVTEQARQAGGSTEDLARLDRLNRRLAVEEPRPYGERTRHGEPGSGGRSFSPYNDLVTNNRGAIDQLRGMDLESPEAGEILARLDDYAERRSIEPHHVENLAAQIKNEQADAARRADEGVGSAPLRRTATSDLSDFYSRPDESPAPSAPLRPVRTGRAPESVSVPRKEVAPIEPEPAARGNVADMIAEDMRRLHAMNPQEIEQALRAAETRRNEDIRNPQMNEVERRMNRDLLKFVNERRHEMVRAKQLPAKNPRGPARGERPTAKEVTAPNPLDQDVTILDDGDLAKRIRDAETILNRATALNPARRKKVEEFLNRAKEEQGKRTPEVSERTVSHPDPAIDGKPILAETADGRVVVANPENKGGVSVVKDSLTTEPKPDRVNQPPVDDSPSFSRARTLDNGAKEISATLGNKEVTLRQVTKGGSWDVVKDGKPIATRLTNEAAKRRAALELTKPDSGVSRERGDVFYSQLERVIDQKMSAKASSAQVRAMVENPQSGVKADEIKWTGLDDFLRSKGEVTKTEVQEFLKANRVEVREVEKGGTGKKLQELKEARDRVNSFNGLPRKAMKIGMSQLDAMNLPFKLMDGRMAPESLPVELQEPAREFLKDNERFHELEAELEEAVAKKPKFGDYTLPGAKEGSYRELLLTMPNKAPETLTELPGGYVVGHDPMASMEQRYHILPPGQSSARPFYGKHASPEAAKAAALEHLNTSRAQNKDAGSYKSSHFDEPNILAHLRFNERTDADGNRMMHVEEIQSDWHQEGRKRGYNDNAREISKAEWVDKILELDPSADRAQTEQSWEVNNRAGFIKLDMVPNAPFKKTWHELAFKRALRYAAENGYDKMTWTTGEQQAERFDLSKQIDRIEWQRNADGSYNISPIKDGRGVLGAIKENVSLSSIEELVGKDIATKIERGEGQTWQGAGKTQGTLSGLDLKVGGEGMKGFYDQILPAFANKYAKKWGAKTGEAKVGTGERAFEKVPRVASDGKRYWLEVNGERVSGDFDSAIKAMDASDEGMKGLKAAHSIDITPAMKESVMGGQPMFQRGDKTPPMPDRVTARDLADNVRAEYRPAKNRPGTVYLNDWGLEALNAAHSIEFADASASGSDRITGGVNYKPERARILAEHIRDRAERPNFTPEGRKNLETMARQIELAADDGAVLIVPMVGQGMGKAKQTIRHEAFHAQQSTISPKIHELTTPRWLPAQKFGAKIGEELGRLGYEKHEHPAEAAAYVASGDWGRFGMSKADARQFLTDYFDDVAYRHGKEAINKFRAIHPELQDVVEARRGTNEPRFGSPGLGRSAEPAISRQRGIEGPGGIAARSRSGVPGGDTGRVPRQSPTAGLRAITPESLRAQSGAGTETPQPRAAESPRRSGLAGITPESLRAEGGGGGRASRTPREPVSGAPVGKDISGWDYIRSPLSNLNFKGTYERLAGDRGRDVSEIIRNAQVEIARKPDTERAALVSDLRKQLKPFKEEFRDNGQPGLANWLDEHVNALSDPDAAFKGLAGFLRGFHYNMKLRYNPKSAGLNWMQPLQTLWPHVTTREFAGLMKDARTPSVRRRVLEIAERESGGQVDEVSKNGRFEAVPKIIRNPFGIVSDTNRVMGHLAGEMFADRMGLTGEAKARMAADWAKKIEYDNSRWDVPPLFRGKIAGVAGQFKPFTIKNIERLHADWKAAPIEELATNTWKGSGTLARRAKMIAGQVAIGGVRSIPGVKTIGGVLVLGALANAFNKAGLPPDEADKAAEMVYFGAPGLVEQDLSSSSMILDAPFGNTPAEQAVNFFGGPTGSLIVKAFKEGETMYDAKSGSGSTAADKRKAAGIRLAKAVTPYSKTVEAAADLAQGNRPALKMERRQVPMTNLEIAGKLGMGTPLRQSKFYDEKDAFDWQKRAARKLRPVRP